MTPPLLADALCALANSPGVGGRTVASAEHEHDRAMQHSPVTVLACSDFHAATLAAALLAQGVDAATWDGQSIPLGSAVVVDLTASPFTHAVIAHVHRLRATDPALRVVMVLNVEPRWSALRETALRLRPDHLLGSTATVEQVAAALRSPHTVAVPPATGLGLRPSQRRVLFELAIRPDRRARLAERLGISVSTIDDHIRAITRCVNDTIVDDATISSTEALIGWARDHHFHLIDPDVLHEPSGARVASSRDAVGLTESEQQLSSRQFPREGGPR